MMFLKSKFVAGFFLLTVLFVSSCGQRPDDTVEVVVDEEGATVSEITDGAVVFGPNGEVLNGGDPELGAALASALTVHVLSLIHI